LIEVQNDKIKHMKNWILQQNTHATTLDDLINIILQNRNITDTDTFLNPKLKDVTPEKVGIDKFQLLKTLKRLKKALDKKEKIIVFGDYDVDGITGTAILWESLHEIGFNTMPYIPNRIEEGYGLSVKGIENVLEKYPDTKIIITVDNGIVANTAVDFANEKNLEVIITDHHMPSEGLDNLPKAFSIVHTTSLCGAGVAYVLSKEVFDFLDLKEKKTKEDRHLELATLATIADLVPLTGANRAIVKHGLPYLCDTKRHGLLEIYRQAAIESKKIGVYEVGHIIGPRLNAAGRLESAMDSLRLLCTNDLTRAQELAFQLNNTNKERQNLMFDSAAHASTHVRSNGYESKKILFVGSENYKEGVIGLVAGRLVEEYYKPAIVLSIGEEKSKGSVRSISGFNIIEFLRLAEDLFINVGGHPMAAGFTVETKNIKALQEKLEQLSMDKLPDELLVRSLKIDCLLDLSDITQTVYDKIQKLGPFGMGNPEPVFAALGVTIDDIRSIGKDGKHLKMKVSQNNSQRFDAIAFGMAPEWGSLDIGTQIDIAFTVDENEWNGRKSLQLKVRDIKRT
jgi:single-stranded-DNA-specific exonuclease